MDLFDSPIPDYSKAVSVIDSCKTLEQLKYAERYVNMFKQQYKIDEHDEISENILIIISNIPIVKIKSDDKWKDFIDYIAEICAVNVKEVKGISSKCKFKHMDLKALIEK